MLMQDNCAHSCFASLFPVSSRFRDDDHSCGLMLGAFLLAGSSMSRDAAGDSTGKNYRSTISRQLPRERKSFRPPYLQADQLDQPPLGRDAVVELLLDRMKLPSDGRSIEASPRSVQTLESSHIGESEFLSF